MRFVPFLFVCLVGSSRGIWISREGGGKSCCERGKCFAGNNKSAVLAVKKKKKKKKKKKNERSVRDCLGGGRSDDVRGDSAEYALSFLFLIFYFFYSFHSRSKNETCQNQKVVKSTADLIEMQMAKKKGDQWVPEEAIEAWQFFCFFFYPSTIFLFLLLLLCPFLFFFLPHNGVRFQWLTITKIEKTKIMRMKCLSWGSGCWNPLIFWRRLSFLFNSLEEFYF